jgi:tetratricopeptide (TPR) repeat protein
VPEFQRAIELKPNYATAHHWYGNGPLVGLGRFEEAIAEGRRAVELDPLSPIINTDLGGTLYCARRYDEAVAQFRKTLELDPTFFYAHENFGIALQLKGDLPGAMAEFEKAHQLSNDAYDSVLGAAAKTLAGDKGAAQKMLTELDRISPHREVLGYWRALLYVSLNEKEKAIRSLEQDLAQRDGSNIGWIRVDPMLDPLHGDPRFEALAERIIPARQFKGPATSK